MNSHKAPSLRFGRRADTGIAPPAFAFPAVIADATAMASGAPIESDTGEDNADAHLKRQVMGREVVVAITKGKLDFGPWEQIFYGEFDGRRPKRVLVKIIGE